MKKRLDHLMLDYSLAASLAEAQSLIMQGKVLVNDQKELKPGTAFKTDCAIRVIGQKGKYVSRGGEKLEGAIAAFNSNAKNKIALDIGVSTGGFTDCLLQHGASHVIGIDVGYGQVAMSLQQDPRVTILERTNARHLTKETLFSRVDIPDDISLVVMDVSFISVRKLMPVIKNWVSSDCQFIILIKPQFEGKKEQIGEGGIVRDPDTRTAIIEAVKKDLIEAGFHIQDTCDSPIQGSKGNKESFFNLALAPLNRRGLTP